MEGGTEAVRDRLIALVEHTLGRGLPRPFPVDQKLSELGVSSMQMVNLMLGVEIEFDVAIPQADITPENFFSLASVAALIVRLKPAG
jgi:acyl carrier protein